MRRWVLLAATLAVAARVAWVAAQHDGIRLPPGFAIETYVSGVANARQIALAPDGTLFVGSRNAGNVYAVPDRDKDGKADKVLTIATGLHMPSGVAFRDGALFVAAVNEILRYDDILAHLDDPPKPAVVTRAFPSDEHHGWKFIAFGPDGKLYVPVGAPCNVCDQPDERYATIMRMNADGTDLEVFARGIRNTVGFDWNPATKELWFTDNGRDALGDDEPPDELDRAQRAGLHFGFPYCHAGRLLDPEFGKGKSCDDYVKPAITLGPHVAAIGMRFYAGTMFPEEYRNQIFIAEHGSWNRSEPLGYRVTVVKLEGNRPVSYQPFAEGWLQGVQSRKGPMTIAKTSGRPADVLVMPDGALLVADDQAGVIYRISYKK